MAKGEFGKSSPSKVQPNLKSSGLSYFAGLIHTADVIRFKRTIFRMTRGNVVMDDIALNESDFDIDFRDFDETTEQVNTIFSHF